MFTTSVRETGAKATVIVCNEVDGYPIPFILAPDESADCLLLKVNQLIEDKYPSEEAEANDIAKTGAEAAPLLERGEFTVTVFTPEEDVFVPDTTLPLASTVTELYVPAVTPVFFKEGFGYEPVRSPSANPVAVAITVVQLNFPLPSVCRTCPLKPGDAGNVIVKLLGIESAALRAI